MRFSTVPAHGVSVVGSPTQIATTSNEAMSIERRSPGSVVVIRWWAGFASLGAGVIHLAVVSEHAAEWWLFGVFFLVLGVVQIAWAAAAMEGNELPVPRLFATLNAAVIGVWVVSRTIGVPVGPEPWVTEAVGVADVIATSLEAVVVVLLLTARRGNNLESTALTKGQLRMIALGALATAVVTVAALIAIPLSLHGGHSHDHGQSHDHIGGEAKQLPPPEVSQQALFDG
jgi:hypothetical protein